MANPSLRIQLSGTDITSMDVTATWTLQNKIEKIFTMIASDGSHTLDLTNITNLTKMMLYSASDFICTFNQSDSVSESIPFIIEGGTPFIFGTTQAFIDSLNSIQISTTSTTEQDIIVRFYGEDAS